MRTKRVDIVCEWCGMTYPEDKSNKGHPLGYPYHKIKVRDVLVEKGEFQTHIICKDCYDRLEEI